MKKSKRVVLFVMSMVLILSMALSGIMTANAATTSNAVDSQLAYKVGLLDALKISKISGVGITEWQGNLTRGEAAFLVAGLVQLDRSRQETIFHDVSTDAYYAGAIASLYNEGIIMKSWGSMKYKPDEPIKYAEFITMICKALGYMGYAESKGGYPSGYLAAAKQFKIVSGAVSTTANIDKADVPSILIKALDAYYLTVSSIDGEGNYETTKQGVVLADYFDAEKYEGIVEEVGPYSINNNFLTGESQICVGGVAFNISGSISNYFDLLGQNVTVYYKEGKSVIYVYPEADNSTVTVDAEDLLPYTTANVVEYYDAEDNKSKVKLDSNYTIVYNGSRLETGDIIPAYGEVTFVDNNADNKFDVVRVTEYVVTTINYVDSYNETITLSDGTVIDISNTDRLFITGTNGKNIKPGTLAKDDVILYAVNQPRKEKNKVYNIIVSKTPVKGKITATGSEEIAVDGTTYMLSELIEGVTCSRGENATVHLDAEGRVIYIDADGYNYKDTKYAIYLGYDQIKGGSRPAWEIELFTQDGAHVYLTIAEKIEINDGGKIKMNSAEAIDFFATLATNQMIKYNISNGEFTEILTATDWGTSYRPWEVGQEFNCYTAGAMNWRTYSGGMFNSWLSLASDAIRFHVVFDENGRFDEEESVVTTARLQNDQSVSNIVLWDIDKSGAAHAYMCDPQYDTISSGKGSNNNPLLLITKVVDAETADGDKGKYIFGIMSGSEKQFFLSEESYEDCGITDTANPFTVGNAVKIRTNANEIVGVMRASKNSTSGAPLYYTKAQLEEADATDAVKGFDYGNPTVRLSYLMVAKVLYVEGGRVYLVQGETAAEAANGLKSCAYPTAGTVYKFDPDGEDLYTTVSWKDIRPSDGVTGTTDALNGSTVLVNVNNYSITDVIILD